MSNYEYYKVPKVTIDCRHAWFGFSIQLVWRGIVSMTICLSTVSPPMNAKAAGEQTAPADIEDPRRLIASIAHEVLHFETGSDTTSWFHPRACFVPHRSRQPELLMTMQTIGGSDYFDQVHWTASSDLGRTWTQPQPIPGFDRQPVANHAGLVAGVCDVVPQYHPATDTVLALGHIVFYRGEAFASRDQLPRYPMYSVRRNDGSWSGRKKLIWEDSRGSFIYSANCGQRVVLGNGDIITAFTFGPTEENRMVAGVRCQFDGRELRVAKVGPPLHNNVGRGLLEPSVTHFKKRFYLTIRAEDGRGYVAASDDGLHYETKKAWAWDDGQVIDMSTTQQHWLTHSDGLYLVYTRKDASNINVIRWRSPLWISKVDPDQLCLVRDTEQIAIHWSVTAFVTRNTFLSWETSISIMPAPSSRG